jgi:hypothetical protein
MGSDEMATITRAQMFPLLIEACPSYQSDWNRFIAEYADDPEPFHYIAITQFAQCLSRALAAGDQDTMRRVFDLLERFIVDGDADTQEAAVVGIIKNLQNASLHHGTAPADYVPFLLPETQRWWGRVLCFWTNGRLLVED